MTVTVYTAPSCMACKLTKKHLEKHGIDYDERSLEEVRDLIDDHRLKTAPVVRVDYDEGYLAWDGFRPDRIDALIA